MALFQRFWRWLTAISRAEWLMADELSGICDVVMLGPGSIEHRELVYCYMRENRQLFTHPGVDPPYEKHATTGSVPIF